jgi:phage tail sheath gpL-like
MPVTPVVAPSVVTPGLYLSVNLLAGSQSTGSGSRRIAILASKSASGNLTHDTERRTITSSDDASTAFGPGTLGHLAAKIIFAKWPAAPVDVVSPTPGATLATLAVTAAGAPTAASVADVDICGRTTQITWEVGESPTEFAAKIIDWILGENDDLPVTAAAGAAGVLNINSKVTGNIGNDVIVECKLRLQTGTETLTGAATPTHLAGGTTDGALTTALTALVGRTYRYIIPCISNADAAATGAANGINKVRTHINLYNTGLDARLQQQVVGLTTTAAAAIATTPHTNSGGNDGTGEMILCIGGRSMPAEFAARECVGRAYATSLDPAANRIGELMDMVYGSHDIVADKPTSAEAEQVIGGGCSLVSYNAQDAMFLMRAVTMHSQTTTGGADRRLLDTQNVDAVYDIAEDLQSALPQEFPNSKITADSDSPTDPLPPRTITPRDIKAFIVSRMFTWAKLGVVDRTKLQTAVDAGDFIVEINSTDASQVDIVVPASILPPLAKMGVQVNRVPA